MNFNPTKSQEYIKKKSSLFKTIDYVQALILGKGEPWECATARSGEWALGPSNMPLDFQASTPCALRAFGRDKI